MILLFIQFELSYDNFHENGDSIYRVSILHKKEGKFEFDSPVFTPPLGPAMKKDFPEVENFVRFSTRRSAYFYEEDRAFKISGMRHADSTLFDIFSFELIAGNSKTMFADPFSIVLTDQTAQRLFGSENPVGKIIKKENRDPFKITGIVKSPPANSTIQFDALLSFSTLYTDPNLFLGWNGGNQYTAYVLLKKGATPGEVEKKFPDFMWRYINKQYANYGLSLEPYLQPLSEIHLHHNPNSESLRANITIFSAIAILILLIACINFINLTTARASKRAKEVGVRKVLGADKQNLIKQFLTETILISLFALLIAFVLVQLFMPIYQELVERELQTMEFMNTNLVLGLFGIIVFAGVFAGSYPAFYLSSFQAVKTLKGVFTIGTGKLKLRNVLVVLQFAISIALIICTLSIKEQLNFIKNKELGFTTNNIVVLPLLNDEMKDKFQVIKNELKSNSAIQNVSGSSEVPHRGFTRNGYIPQGFKNPVMIHVVDADEDFLNTFEIELVNGRYFSKEFPTDKNAYLVNESLVSMVGWDNPLGKTIRRGDDHPVIGVVKDFHFSSLYNEIAPLIINHQPWQDRFDYVSVRIDPSSIHATINAIRATWQKFDPLMPFEYWFLSDSLDKVYYLEQRFQKIFYYFSSLAIFVALLGLFGLASFSAQQRTKEIGIRKVLGSSIGSILYLLTREFTLWVLLANMIAWPIAWISIGKWLENFAYRTDIGLVLFLIAGGFALIIALLMVSFQALKAAVANPVESLRYE